jgi:hypothetical protein
VTEETIKIISNVFILCGAVLFVAAIALAIIRERQNKKANFPFDVTEQAAVKQKEGRRLKRAPYEKDLKYSYSEPPYTEGTAKGRDLHHEGAGLLMPVHAKVRKGTKLDLELFLEGEKEPLRIMGEIVWAEGLEDEKMEKLSLISEFFARRVGVKFKDLNENYQQRIKLAVKGTIAESEKNND